MVISIKNTWRLLLWVPLGAALAACGQDQDEAADRARPAQIEEEKGPSVAEKRAWSGAKVYDEVCDKCHKMGVDEAPVVGETGAWAPRIDKGEDVLYRHVLEGFNEMPARGECEFCTDQQLRAAMEHMIEESRSTGSERAEPDGEG